MSHTNSTPNYSLPQFIATDQPGWMSDVNNAMSVIDASVKAVDDATVANAANVSTITARLNASLPESGTVGHVLTKTASGAVFAAVPVDQSLDASSNIAVSNSAVTTKTNAIDTQINDIETDIAGLGSVQRGIVQGSGVSGDVYYAQIGKIVVGSFWINATNGIAAGATIISGLPNNRVNNELVDANNNNNATTVRLYITTDGRISSPAAISANASLRGGFMYIAE